MEIVNFATDYVFGLFLVFCRIGCSLMLFPLFADNGVTPTVRLVLAGGLSMICYPAIADQMPQYSPMPFFVISSIFSEIMTGIFIGLVVRLFLSAVHILGMVIAAQSGLAMATLFDPAQALQNSLPGIFFSVLILCLMALMDLDHMLIKGLLSSYEKFKVGEFILGGEFYLESIVGAIGESFSLGIRLSMPFIIVSVLVMLASGVIARLMPSIQIFFVAMPAQILVLVLTLAFSVSVICTVFIDEYKAFLNSFFG